MFDGQRQLVTIAAQIEVAVAPGVELGGAAQRLAGAGVGRTLAGVMDDEDGHVVAALQVAQIGEERRDLAAGVLVVHHARKGAGNARAGQALRGSSEFHAWGDSNLYLRRDGDDLSLTVEHRAAPSLAPIMIELAQRGPALALEVVDRPEPTAPNPPAPSNLDDRIMAALAEAAGTAMPFADLRALIRVRAATLYERLAALAAAGRIAKTDTGYRRASD